MPTPTKSFTNVPDNKIDADSPITEELLTWIRDNLVNLRERLGVGSAELQNHSHRGLAVDGTEAVDTLVAFPYFIGLAQNGEAVFGGSAGTFSDVFLMNVWIPPGITKIVVPLWFYSSGTPYPQLRLQLRGATTDNGAAQQPTPTGTYLKKTLELTPVSGNKGRECVLAVQLDRASKIARVQTPSSPSNATDQILNAHFE